MDDIGTLYEELIIAGFGGQGIMLAGKLLAQASMVGDHQVTFMPSYGAEVRGGTANCMVVIADEPIAAPLVTDPDSLIALNKASVTKFTKRIKAGGLLVVNSSMVEQLPQRNDVTILPVPADNIAVELNSPRSANMVVLGAYLAQRGFLDIDAVVDCLADVLAKRHHHTLDVNAEALRRGAALAETVITQTGRFQA